MAIQTPKSVGEIVRDAMKTAERSQHAVARHMGVSQPYVFRRLNGDVEFNISDLSTIAAYLHIPLGDLLPVDLPRATPAAPAVDSSPQVSAVGASSSSDGKAA